MSDPVIVALDVGGTGIKGALVGADGAVRHAEHHATRAERGPAHEVQELGGDHESPSADRAPS